MKPIRKINPGPHLLCDKEAVSEGQKQQERLWGGSQHRRDPQRGEHRSTGGGQHRSPAQPSAPSRRVPAPAATLPPAFLRFLATRKPQKRNRIRINSRSPREAEPDARSEQRPRIARGTAAARSAFRGHRHQSFFIFFFFFSLFQALFEDCCQHLALSPAVPPGTELPADGEHQHPERSSLAPHLSAPVPLRLLLPARQEFQGAPKGADGCQRTAAPHRRTGTLLLSGTSIRGFNYCE